MDKLKVAFVTGGTGFIGNHLIERLMDDNWSVRALVHKKNIPKRNGLELIKGDIGDLSLLKEAMKGADAVFHLAAALGASTIGREEFYRINVQGTTAILRASAQSKVKRIIHFSSAGVLGKVISGLPANEDSSLNPQNVYDQTKRLGEEEALRSSDAGLDVVVVRPGWVYGPGDKRTFKLIRAIAKKRFFLVTEGTTVQTPVHVHDLVEGILLVLDKGKTGSVYHLAGGEVMTVKEIVMTIASATGTSIPKIRLPLLPIKSLAWLMDKAFKLMKKEAPLTPAKLAFFTHPKPLDIQKARSELDYDPTITFGKGMPDVVSWYQEQGWME
jgi:dihydroflavonol-4-reductase